MVGKTLDRLSEVSFLLLCPEQSAESFHLAFWQHYCTDPPFLHGCTNFFAHHRHANGKQQQIKNILGDTRQKAQLCRQFGVKIRRCFGRRSRTYEATVRAFEVTCNVGENRRRGGGRLRRFLSMTGPIGVSGVFVFDEINSRIKV